jgi:hypothetical protein
MTPFLFAAPCRPSISSTLGGPATWYVRLCGNFAWRVPFGVFVILRHGVVEGGSAGDGSEGCGHRARDGCVTSQLPFVCELRTLNSVIYCASASSKCSLKDEAVFRSHGLSLLAVGFSPAPAQG